MPTNSIYNTFIRLHEASSTSAVFTWNNYTYDRSDFLNIISILVDTFKKYHIVENDIVMFYGSNHPIALAMPFACSCLKLKYFAVPDSVPASKAQSIKANYKIKLTITTEESYDFESRAEDLWKQFKNDKASKPIPRPISTQGQFYIGFLTSGSTGNPKLILLSESHIIANINASILGHQLKQTDSILAVLNICHSGGLCIQTLPALFSGIPITLHKNFNVNTFVTEINKGNTNITLIVPSFLKLLRMSSYWTKNIFSNFKIIGIGSAHLDPLLAKECLEYKIPLMSIYGLTEAGPFAIYGMIKSIQNGLVNIGKPAEGVQVKLSPEPNSRIFLKGASVQPLIDDGEQCLSLLDSDGWLDTGDEGIMIDGEYYFTNRKSDIANIGGLKVNIIDVENIIGSIEDVVACAVFSRKHSLFNEVLVACIEVGTTSTVRKKISARCKELLPRHMVPRNIYIVDKLPRSTVGKVQKNELKKLYG